MNVQEFYSLTGGNYEDILHRLRDEERILKFLTKFTEDQSFAQIGRAMEKGDCETAFRASHSLKGICMNLGLTCLQESSGALTENLRGGGTDEKTSTLLDKTVRDYGQTLAALKELLNAQRKDGSNDGTEG